MAFSPIPSYLFGTMFTGIGVLSIVAPRADYQAFGLPLEPSPTAPAAATSPAEGSVSPMVFAKGVRDLAFGLTFFALQYKGLAEAVTVFSGVLCFVALADGCIVWQCGGSTFRSTAVVHWGGLVPFAAWVAWRVQNA